MQVLEVGPRDRLNIICPGPGLAREQHVVYNVERREWRHCRVEQDKPRIIAQCDQRNSGG